MERRKKPVVIPDAIYNSAAQWQQNHDTQLVLEAFKSTGYLILNKTLIKKLGYITSGVLCNYIDKYQYFRSKSPDFNGWFFLKHSDIMEQLNLNEFAVVKSKKELIELKVIKSKMAGMPIKEWIWIDFVELGNQLISLTPYSSGGTNPNSSGGTLRRLNNNEYISSKPKLKKEEYGITLQDFDKFWKEWPVNRRGSKGKALSSWMKLCTPSNKFRPEWQRLRAAIIKQKQSDQWQQEQFIPLAATWLNNKRWMDDPKSLKRYRFDNEKTEQHIEDIEPTGLRRQREREELESEG